MNFSKLQKVFASVLLNRLVKKAVKFNNFRSHFVAGLCSVVILPHVLLQAVSRAIGLEADVAYQWFRAIFVWDMVPVVGQ